MRRTSALLLAIVVLAGCTTAAAGISPTASAGTGLVDIGAGLTGRPA